MPEVQTSNREDKYRVLDGRECQPGQELDAIEKDHEQEWNWRGAEGCFVFVA